MTHVIDVASYFCKNATKLDAMVTFDKIPNCSSVSYVNYRLNAV